MGDSNYSFAFFLRYSATKYCFQFFHYTDAYMSKNVFKVETKIEFYSGLNNSL